MSTHYEDWADWAGDHPQEAEADLRAERVKAYQATLDKIGASAGCCDHEFHLGVCLICEEVDEDYDPTPMGEELVTDHADSSDYSGRVAA
jgi:hypothetical protein